MLIFGSVGTYRDRYRYRFGWHWRDIYRSVTRGSVLSQSLYRLVFTLSFHNENRSEVWEYSCWDYDTTDYFKYRRCTCVVKITHSHITLVNLSSINLVSIFRCSSPPHNPVYVRRVDPSSLPFSFSSHRHQKKNWIDYQKLISSECGQNGQYQNLF